MNRNFVLSQLPNEDTIIRGIPGEKTIPLECEEVGSLPNTNPDWDLWRRRAYVLSRACYEVDDVNCRYFPPTPAEYKECAYTFEIDFNEDRTGRIVGRELNQFYKLLSQHMIDGNEVMQDFGVVFKEFSDVFGIDRGTFHIASRRFTNHGTTSFIDFAVTNVPGVNTAWLKLQTEMNCTLEGDETSVIMDFSQQRIPPTLIIGDCDTTMEPVTCSPGVIERPVQRFELTHDQWLIKAFEYCLTLKRIAD